MKKGVDYPGVSIVYFCHDGDGNYLFNKRGEGCRDENGRWDSGSGGLDLGDTVEDTLRKEIKEEYCTDVLEHEFLGYHDVFREQNGVTTHWLAIVFRALVDKKTAANGEPHKFDEIGWFRLDNLPSPLHSQLMPAIKLFGDKLV